MLKLGLRVSKKKIGQGHSNRTQLTSLLKVKLGHKIALHILILVVNRTLQDHQELLSHLEVPGLLEIPGHQGGLGHLVLQGHLEVQGHMKGQGQKRPQQIIAKARYLYFLCIKILLGLALIMLLSTSLNL